MGRFIIEAPQDAVRYEVTPERAAATTEQKILASAPVRFLKGLKDPIDAAAQMLAHGAEAIGVAEPINQLAAALGLQPATAAQLDQQLRDDEARYQAARIATTPRTLGSLVTGQVDPGMDIARGLGNIAPVAAVLKPAQAVSLPARVGMYAAQGAAGSALQPVLNEGDFATQKATQAGIGAASGAVLGPVAEKAIKAATPAVNAIARKLNPPSKDAIIADAMTALQRAAQTEGIDLGQLPKPILESVKAQAIEALSAGKKIDATAMVRKADFEALKIQPTLGQITRDPGQFSREQNLRGIENAGESLAQRFNQQNAQLIDALNSRGAATAAGPFDTSQRVISAFKEADKPLRQNINDLYQLARDSSGRYANLDASEFARMANDALDEKMLGYALPAGAKRLLNDVASGKIPLNVNTAEQLKTVFGNMSRGASVTDAERYALGILRDSLENTPLRMPPKAPGAGGSTPYNAQQLAGNSVPQPGGPSLPIVRQGGQVGPARPAPSQGPATIEGEATVLTDDAVQAFKDARAAARSRFQILEEAPAMKAALDDAQPDNFFQKFILGGTQKELKAAVGMLDEETQAAVKAEVVNHLKNSALNGAKDEVGRFSQSAFNRELNKLKPKLHAIMSPQEVAELERVGRVASYIQAEPAGGAVNRSNTAAAAMNLLSKLGRVPYVRELGVQPLERLAQRTEAEKALAAKVANPREPGPTPNAFRRLMAPLPFFAGSYGGDLSK